MTDNKKVNISQYETKSLYQLVKANNKVFGYIKSEQWLLNKVEEMFIYTEEQKEYLITKFKNKF